MSRFDFTALDREEFYLSDPGSLERALRITGLAADEIESLVGRFGPQSSRAGRLRGKIVIQNDTVEIRRCFGGALIWKNQED